jgi:hypothetical protein
MRLCIVLGAGDLDDALHCGDLPCVLRAAELRPARCAVAWGSRQVSVTEIRFERLVADVQVACGGTLVSAAPFEDEPNLP